MTNVHDNTRELERRIGEYTGASHVVVLDNNCNGIFLCLRYLLHIGQVSKYDRIRIPSHTYVGVPYAVRAAGLEFEFVESPEHLTGEYQLSPAPLWDSALRFTSGMYRKGQFQVLSFTGPYKHLKVQKGGAILTDSPQAHAWLSRAAYSGRNAVSYHDDTFDMTEGYNMYLPPSFAALGVQMMDGIPMHSDDLTMRYPDLSDPKNTGLNT